MQNSDVNHLFKAFNKSLKKSEEKMIRYFNANFKCRFVGGAQVKTDHGFPACNLHHQARGGSLIK